MDFEETFEQEWTHEFHGIIYYVYLYSNASVLKIEVEQIGINLSDVSSCWSGEFSLQYIEEISQKAGNFKKYSIFLKMLISGFDKDSDSVFIDLLTYSDLELLKARKSGSHMSVTTSTSTTNAKTLLKRYLILTYSGEFDRVHYPLPLAHTDSPSIATMQRTIRRLRSQLMQLQGSSSLSVTDGQTRPPTHIQIETGTNSDVTSVILSQLRGENQELRHQLRLMQGRVQAQTGRSKSKSRGGSDSGSNNGSVRGKERERERGKGKSGVRAPSPSSISSREDLSIAYQRLKSLYERTRLQLAQATTKIEKEKVRGREREREKVGMRARSRSTSRGLSPSFSDTSKGRERERERERERGIGRCT
mmetsp:Transcript_39346/g.40075  ORF Transcript_39346/g.40075 Transcript_39346/m.40075 type:complete len:362 (+) Transcript_39346:168-1253(+)